MANESKKYFKTTCPWHGYTMHYTNADNDGINSFVCIKCENNYDENRRISIKEIKNQLKQIDNEYEKQTGKTLKDPELEQLSTFFR